MGIPRLIRNVRALILPHFVCNAREMKAVNVWYQNKRRSMKKKSLAWSRASETPLPTFVPPHLQSRSRLLRAVSLDAIASSKELKDVSDVQSVFFAPSRVRRSASRPPHSFSTSTGTYSEELRNESPEPGPSRQDWEDDMMEEDTREIWEHIPSSPHLPPSSPSDDAARFAVLPPSSRLLHSLEWACAKDRMNRRRHRHRAEDDEPAQEEKRPRRARKKARGGKVRAALGRTDAEIPSLELDAVSNPPSEGEVEELITPDTSLTMDPNPAVVHAHTHASNDAPTWNSPGRVSVYRTPKKEVRGWSMSTPGSEMRELSVWESPLLLSAQKTRATSSEEAQLQDSGEPLPAEDMEAAMALLGFSSTQM